MRDLKCGLTNCKHNRAYCCNAKKIEVTSSTDCSTYEPMGNKESNSLFEAGTDFGADYSQNTKVHCTAPCLFSQKDYCIANGITVMSEQPGEAVCVTFIRECEKK